MELCWASACRQTSGMHGFSTFPLYHMRWMGFGLGIRDRLALIHPLKRGHLPTVQFTKQSSPEKVKTKVQWILSLKRIDINNWLFLYSSVQASVIFKKGVIQRPNSGTVLSPFAIISVSCPDFTLLCMSQGGGTLRVHYPAARTIWIPAGLGPSEQGFYMEIDKPILKFI